MVADFAFMARQVAFPRLAAGRAGAMLAARKLLVAGNRAAERLPMAERPVDQDGGGPLAPLHVRAVRGLGADGPGAELGAGAVGRLHRLSPMVDPDAVRGRRRGEGNKGPTHVFLLLDAGLCCPVVSAGLRRACCWLLS